ncbi:MAG: DNA repair protein RadC, partial [Thermomicrobiales bacterium]
LLLRGAADLSNGDLLAILINTGLPGEPATQLARRILHDHGGLAGLAKLDVVELASIRGIGAAKATRIKAALELANRLRVLTPGERPRIASPDDVVEMLGIEMAALEQEELRVVLLDTKHHVLAIRTTYRGTANQANVRVAEVFRDAIRHGAVAIVVVHNHPSGDPTPSAADVALTAELARAGTLLEVEVIDHLVIGQGRHASLRRLGLGFPARGGG